MKVTELSVDTHVINTLYKDGVVKVQRPQGAHINSYGILRGPSSTAHGYFVDDNTFALSANDKALTFNRISPRDAAQKAFLDSLARRDRLLTLGQGRAGSGKTLLTLAWAFDALQAGDYQRIIFTKPNTVVGNTFGFGAVPGDLNDKFSPFLASYEDTFVDIGLEKNYISTMIDKNRIEFRPVQYLRGANLTNSILVIDEVQNLSWHELKTILTRAATGSKVVAIGDPSQNDVKRKTQDTGFHTLVTSSAFANADYTSWVTFEKQYRTDLCELVENIDMELQIAVDGQRVHS